MNNDGRTTSEQLYIPNLLIVGGSQSLLLRCFHASKTMGLAIKACTPAEATAIMTRRHPIAIVVPNDVFAGAAYELVALARDVRSALLPVDPEVSVRELEAMIAAAVDGGFSQRERRGGAGRYSIVDGIEDEAPYSRRTLPPASTRDGRSSAPPEVRQSVLPEVRKSVAPGDVRQSLPPSPGLASTRPSAPPVSVRPSVLPASVRVPTAPVSARSPAAPVSVRSPAAPVSVRPSAPVGPSVASAPVRPPVAPSQERPSAVPVSRTLPSLPAPAPAESAPPSSGVQKGATSTFAAIRSVFSSRR